MAKFKQGDKIIRTYDSIFNVVLGETYTVFSCTSSIVRIEEDPERDYDPGRFTLKESFIPKEIIGDISTEFLN